MMNLHSKICESNIKKGSNADAKRLYDDLITGYNRLIRPVGNNTDKLTVYMGLKLTQILDVVSSYLSFDLGRLKMKYLLL